MADQYVQLPSDSGNTGRKVDVSELTVNAQTVERQRVVLADPTTAAGLGKVTNAAPALTDYGLVVHPSPASAAGHGKTRNLVATPVAVKASAGTLFGLQVINTTGAAAYVQVFDVATGGVTPGTTTPDLEFLVPAGTALNVPLPERGVAFGTAITIVSTTGEGGAVASASGVHAFYQYA